MSDRENVYNAANADQTRTNKRNSLLNNSVIY